LHHPQQKLHHLFIGTIPQYPLGDHGKVEDLSGGWRRPLEVEE